MGNCFSSEKAASPDAQQAIPSRKREKSGSLPHIEPTDGKLSTSVEFDEKPRDDVPLRPTAVPTDMAPDPTLDLIPDSPVGRKFSEFNDPRDPPKTPPQIAAEEQGDRRPSASGTIDSGKAMSVDGRSPKDAIAEAQEEEIEEEEKIREAGTRLEEEEEKPAIPEKSASRHNSLSAPVALALPDTKDEALLDTEVEDCAAVKTGRSHVPAEKRVPATREKEDIRSPVEEVSVAAEEASTSASTESIPTATEESREITAPTVASEEPLSETKKTTSLPQLNTTLSSTHDATTEAVPVTASSTASPSSFKSPQETLTQQETAQTSPPTSARPMTASSYKGSLSLFPTEIKHDPSTSPVIVPITPQNTSTDPSGSIAGPPSRTQSTVDSKSEKLKRQSRISRMFSVGLRKEKSIPELPNRTTSKKHQQQLIEERRSIVPPVPAIQTTAKMPRPLSNGTDGSVIDASSVPLPLASPTEAVSPNLEGRKWNQEGDNESLYCY